MPEEHKILRAYILNEVGEKERELIEERLVTDEDFFRELSIVEEMVVQEYADGKLTQPQRANFEKCFLISDENRQKVRFARALRKYVDDAEEYEDFKKKASFFESLKAFLLSPVPITAAVIIILGIGGFWFWKSYSSNSSDSLIALNEAFRAERPFEARISDFGYAAPRNTRGDDNENKVDKIQLDRAARTALQDVSENASAKNLHALGLVYLTEKKFDQAIEQLEKASKAAPDNAKFHNDLGVAFMEKAKTQEENFEYLDRSIKEFEKAIELSSSLNEAYFNKALAIQLVPSQEAAKQAWREYLKIDPNSQWSIEAERNLQKLESTQNKEISAEELEENFLNAFRDGEDEKAWEMLSRNKEVIQTKYLPQKLAMSISASSEKKKDEWLQALIYAGKLEKERTNDLFVSDLSNFYINLNQPNNEKLRQAHKAINEGYILCRKTDFREASVKFRLALNILNQIGNVWEEKITEVFLAYSLNHKDQIDERLNLIKKTVEFSGTNNYKWLQTLSLYRLADYQMNLTQYNDALKNFEKAAILCEEIQDFYNAQRSNILLAAINSTLGQKKAALGFVRKAFKQMAANDTSSRQKWRNYFSASDLFASLRFDQLTKVTAQEMIILSEPTDWFDFISISQSQLGVYYAQAENYDEARNHFNNAIVSAEKLKDETSKNTLSAYSLLKLANLERKAKNYEKSLELYDRSFAASKSPYFEYETQKGRLLSYLNTGNETELEQQIPQTIDLLEKSRKEIAEEQRKNSYFNSEQNIYDIATEWEFNRGNHQKAFDYAEESNARSLLTLLKNEDSKPAELTAIQAQMPPKVQLLQYTVLEKKVLIWLVSKEKFLVKESNISTNELNEKVQSYLKILLKNEKDSRAEINALSHELYNLLITPVKEHLDSNKEVCIIPQKVLFHLPFQALTSSQNQPFLKEFAVFYSPSANVLLLSTQNAASKSSIKNEELLSIGNPSFDQTVFKNLQNLPAAEAEAREIAGFYDKQKILIGSQATKNAVQDQLKKSEIIHYAGHYSVKSDAPLYSSLILAKSARGGGEDILTNEELVREKLPNAKLVVLSACQTGVEAYLGGEGLIGLSRTFLIANAPLIVASKWKVDSDATAKLMIDFHKYRRQEKLSTVEALRRAQMKMIDSPDGEYNTPYYWAAFSAFGGYAAF